MKNEHNFPERQARTLKNSMEIMQSLLLCENKCYEECFIFVQFMTFCLFGYPFLWVTLYDDMICVGDALKLVV